MKFLKTMTLALALSLPVQSHAAESKPVIVVAEDLAQQAKERFKAGEFEVAAKMFMNAYAKSHAPAMVFNAARAYENAGKNGDAASLFRLYVSLSDDTDGMIEARQHLAKLNTPSPVIVQPPQARPTPRPVAPMVPVAVTPAPSHTAAWAVTGGAAAAVLSGVTLIGIASADSNQANADYRRTGDLQAYRNAYSTSQTEWWAGVAITGAGAVLGGVSVYMWNKPVTVTPMGKGIAFGGSF